jgi:hypothetical protein
MAEVHLRALAWKEARLNEVLPALQVEFHKMLQKGELPQLEADYKEWLDSAFAAMQNRELEDPTDAANGGS